MKNKVHVFYHSADLDGKCSGALLYHFLSNLNEVVLHGFDYGQEFPFEEMKDQVVYMADVSLQPFEDMLRLANLAKSFIWVDHHISQIVEFDAAMAAGKIPSNVDVRLDSNFAACELCWQYLRPTRVMPKAVELLGRYDVWDLDSSPQVLPFQFGMRALKNDPQSPVWAPLFDENYVALEKILEKGETILGYQTEQYEQYARDFAFDALLKLPIGQGFMPVIAMNVGRANSKAFEAVYDPEKHRAMVPFVMKKNGAFKFSLYTTHGDVDCSAIAKHYGGGGHRKAAGFTRQNFDDVLLLSSSQ